MKPQKISGLEKVKYCNIMVSQPNKQVNPKPAKVSCVFKRSQSGSGARSATGVGPLRSLKSTQQSTEDTCFPLWRGFLQRRFSLQQDLVPSGPQGCSQSDLGFH